MRHAPSTDEREDHDSRLAIVRLCADLADSTAFNFFIFGVILANAAVLGMETYPKVARDYGDLLRALNDVFLGIFVVELLIRLTGFGRRPHDFFRSGWNVFDFLVVAASFAPGLRENAMLLRIARLARVLRIVRLLPDLRVLVTAIGRSIPGVMSLAVLALLVLFVYGMIGWTIFQDHAPRQYGTIGEAMLTLFVALTLENLPDQLALGRDLSEWTLLYFISYALIAAFLIFNILIGVVINSLEEARAIEHARERADSIAQGGPAGPTIEQRVADVREALTALEADVRDR
ncbi:MAG TPA: ion transporter [Solirubrobacteraceae bacterium]|jgi:voltage-gated sodium channel|nr:ion transporter [Solirubrobacteraceae bacterium]